MKRELFAALTVFALMSGGQALAQTAIKISPEQVTKIKEYIVKEKVTSVNGGESLAVGATVPANITLMPAPPAWGASFLKYQYINSGGHVLLVEPASRKVVQVIE